MGDPTNKANILIVDDEKNIRQAVDLALSQEELRVLGAHDSAAALRCLGEESIDLLILDIRLGEIDGVTFYKKLLNDGWQIPTIFISGQASLQQAAEAVKAGAFDFLEKPFSSERLVVTVNRALEHGRMQSKLAALEETTQSSDIIGTSPVIQQLKSEIAKVAKTNASVLIAGESGSGKELVAQMLHRHSPRRDANIVKVNCSAIPETLIESELFGYERGAFTGAQYPKRGLFETANRGTIFLDEVADLSLAAQAKVLRVLQSGEIQKVGSEKILRVDVRVVAATHKDLKKNIASGLFREDLYYRLNVVPLRVPSLRERGDDLTLLIHYFLKELTKKNNLKEKSIDPEALQELQRYSWPGNIRELQNVLERAVILSGDRILLKDLPEEIQAVSDDPKSSVATLNLKDFRDRAEREFVIATLKRLQANITQAASDLGIGRTYLHKRMLQLGITKKDYIA